MADRRCLGTGGSPGDPSGYVLGSCPRLLTPVKTAVQRRRVRTWSGEHRGGLLVTGSGPDRDETYTQTLYVNGDS